MIFFVGNADLRSLHVGVQYDLNNLVLNPYPPF